MFFKHYFVRNSAVIVVTILMCASIVSCAKERSPEDKKREDERRQNERLQRAKGMYSGYALTENDDALPAALSINLLQNPDKGNDKPILEVKLKLGFFDGVTITSTSTSFDWKSGELNASFNGKSGATPSDGKQFALATTANGTLELNAMVADQAITSATISGSYTGVSKLVLERIDKLQLTHEARTFGFNLVAADSYAAARTQDPFAFLTLKTQPDSHAQPARSDLPSLVSIVAGFEFYALKHNESTNNVLYDPLEGTLRIRNQSHSEFVFKNLFANSQEDVADSTLLSRGLSGELFISGNQSRNIYAFSAEREINTQPNALSKVYVGEYLPPAQQSPYKVVAYLDHLGRVGQNPGEMAFATFPATRLRMLICAGSVPHSQRDVELFYLDYIAHLAKFTLGASDAYIYQFHYDNNWQALSGEVLRRTSGSTGSPGAYGAMNLRATNKPYHRGCADLASEGS